MDKSTKNWLLGGLFIIGLVLILYFAGVIGQTVYGNSVSYADCRVYVKDYLCTEGYKCFDCKVKSGMSTFGADCYLNPDSVPSSSDICRDSSSVTSHARYSCYSGSVYWFNSLGVREELKTYCANGCTDTSLKTASCMSGSNKCSPSGSVKCVGSVAKICAMASNGLDWFTVKDCGSVGCSLGKCNVVPNQCGSVGSIGCNSRQVCEAGVCVYRECSNFNASTCISDTAYSFCAGAGEAKGMLNTYNCASGKVCKMIVISGTKSSARCVNPDSPDVPPPSFDCSGVSCPDSCDSMGSYSSNGVCSVVNQGCVYGSVVTNSPKCLSTACPIVALPPDGSSCGVNRVWKLGTNSVGCSIVDCVSKGMNYLLVGVIVGVLCLIIVFVYLFVNKRGKK